MRTALVLVLVAGIGVLAPRTSSQATAVDGKARDSLFCADFLFTACGPGEHQLLGPSPGG